MSPLCAPCCANCWLKYLGMLSATQPGNVLMVGGVLRLADFSESMLFNGKPLLLEQAR